MKPQSESNHKSSPLVGQVPCHDQLPLLSLSGSDIIRRDELVTVSGPGGSGSIRSRSENIQVAWLGASIEMEGFI